MTQSRCSDTTRKDVLADQFRPKRSRECLGRASHDCLRRNKSTRWRRCGSRCCWLFSGATRTRTLLEECNVSMTAVLGQVHTQKGLARLTASCLPGSCGPDSWTCRSIVCDMVYQSSVLTTLHGWAYRRETYMQNFDNSITCLNRGDSIVEDCQFVVHAIAGNPNMI